jgi:hypothetical protein
LSLVSGYLNFNQTVKVEDFIGELENYIKQFQKNHADPNEAILSYVIEHLALVEQNILRQLSILSGGFTTDFARELSLVGGNDEIDPNAIQAYLNAFTQMNLLVFDPTLDYYYLQSSIQRYMQKKSESLPELWLKLGKAYSDSIDWLNSLANKSADTFMLSLLILDEHKATIKKILNYLQSHRSQDGDRILLGFLDLIRSSGNTRFSLSLERLPYLESMMKAASRIQNSALLIVILEDLSNIFQMLGEKEKSLYFSKLQADIIRNQLIMPLEGSLEGIIQVEDEKKHVVHVNKEARSASIPLNLEHLSINETKIVLTGFMGTGKTTVGKLLADNLNYRFIDTDELIESRHNRSISDIFKELGEDAFREMERSIVKELAGIDGVVISTGGRLMLDPENVKALCQNSRVLCLVATPDEILTRVELD